jgi:hypothetical protein
VAHEQAVGTSARAERRYVQLAQFRSDDDVCSYFLMPPVGFEPTTFGLKVTPMQVFSAVPTMLGCAGFA